MTFLQIIFYLFSAVAIGSALMVIVAKNSVHSILFLVLAFFAMAGIWILLSAEFLALILVLVYVGAVMTLFLFVVMMLNIDKEKNYRSFVKFFPIAALVVALVTGLIIKIIGPTRFGLAQNAVPTPFPSDYSNTADLGSVLYTNFAYPFEIAGAILLTAIIAAICLTHRPPKNRKVQNVNQQVAVNRDEAVKLLKMLPENKVVLPRKEQ